MLRFFGRVEGQGGGFERKLGLLKACWLNGTIKYAPCSFACRAQACLEV